MKIAYLITKSNWGGAQKYVFELATSLNKDLYKVQVILGTKSEELNKNSLVEKLESQNIKVIPIEYLGRNTDILNDLKAFKELWTIIRHERPDILHINSSKAGGMGALIGRMLGVPKIIFTAHGWAFNEDRPFYQKMTIKILHWITILLCHQTIAVSENIKNAYVGWPGVSGKISVIYNGIKGETSYAKNGARLTLVNMFPELKNALEQKHVFWIGTIAELHPIKNVDGALKAISELIKQNPNKTTAPFYLYTVMGEGGEREYLEKMIIELNLSEHVFLLGHVKDAFQYIKAFDIFLLPSKSEALAYVLLEAGLQEIPVVATGVGGIPEVIDDMSSGILLQPDKSKEIAHAISFYAEHPEIARQHAKVLNEKVKKDFTLERMANETEKLYQT